MLKDRLVALQPVLVLPPAAGAAELQGIWEQQLLQMGEDCAARGAGGATGEATGGEEAVATAAAGEAPAAAAAEGAEAAAAAAAEGAEAAAAERAGEAAAGVERATAAEGGEAAAAAEAAVMVAVAGEGAAAAVVGIASEHSDTSLPSIPCTPIAAGNAADAVASSPAINGQWFSG